MARLCHQVAAAVWKHGDRLEMCRSAGSPVDGIASKISDVSGIEGMSIGETIATEYKISTAG
jgi:hypothetical protein